MSFVVSIFSKWVTVEVGAAVLCEEGAAWWCLLVLQITLQVTRWLLDAYLQVACRKEAVTATFLNLQRHGLSRIVILNHRQNLIGVVATEEIYSCLYKPNVKFVSLSIEILVYPNTHELPLRMAVCYYLWSELTRGDVDSMASSGIDLWMRQFFIVVIVV